MVLSLKGRAVWHGARAFVNPVCARDPTFSSAGLRIACAELLDDAQVGMDAASEQNYAALSACTFKTSF